MKQDVFIFSICDFFYFLRAANVHDKRKLTIAVSRKALSELEEWLEGSRRRTE